MWKSGRNSTGEGRPANVPEREEGANDMGQALIRAAAVFGLAAVGGIAAFGGDAAAELDNQSFKVVGPFGNLTNWTGIEQPFWDEQLPADSDGALTADAKPMTELGLKGFEIMRLLRLGVFDFAHALPIYVAEDPVIEGVDLAGVARDFESARAIADAYKPTLDKAFGELYNAKLLNIYPFPTQAFYCREDIGSVEDLAGAKIRVQGASQGDFVEGLGATPVTITFAEVVPSLEKSVVDCGITGTMPAYLAKWYEVANTAFYLPVGYTITFTAVNLDTWNALSAETQAFMEEAMADFEERAWEIIIAENDLGLACGTSGPCEKGEPGGMTLVEPSEADLEAREKILTEVVLPRWAERCGEECTANWNETIGPIVDLKAEAK
jgi:TRAP-type C4-dicarboxylate transport system substrate-binding protein